MSKTQHAEPHELGGTQTEFYTKLQAQKELTLEYYTLLTQAEKDEQALREEHLQQQEQAEAQILGLKERLTQAEAKIPSIESQLQEQRELTRKYFQALSDAEMEQVKMRSKVQDLEDYNRQLRSWMGSLQADFEALLRSRRWRLGNSLGQMAGFFCRRFRRPGAVQRMQQVFTYFSELESSANAMVKTGALSGDHSRLVIAWMDRLDKEFQAVLRSRRWRLGNVLVRTALRLTGRFRPPVSVHRMQDIFAAFREWKHTMHAGELSRQEIKQLQKWMNQLEKDFQALRASRRWRLGNALLLPTRILFWRDKKPRPMDRVQKIFAQYRS